MRQIYVPDQDTLPKTTDVVVIGGAIVGVATAFWLSKASSTRCWWKCARACRP